MRGAAAVLAALLLAAAAVAQAPASCSEQAWGLAGQGQFRKAANAMALCPEAQAPADLALLAHLAQIEGALQQANWPEAASAMQRLPAALPAALNATLAPAFARFGAGSPAQAATLARAAARRKAATALPFQSFLRHEYTARLWRRFALPGVALFLAVLIASLALGLRLTLSKAAA